MVIKVCCPNCGQKLSFEPRHVGKTGKCPRCAAPVPVTDAASPPQEASDVTGETREMTPPMIPLPAPVPAVIRNSVPRAQPVIQFFCASCGKHISLAENPPGGYAKCPHCDAITPVDANPVADPLSARLARLEEREEMYKRREAAEGRAQGEALTPYEREVLAAKTGCNPRHSLVRIAGALGLFYCFAVGILHTIGAFDLWFNLWNLGLPDFSEGPVTGWWILVALASLAMVLHPNSKRI